MREVLYLTLLVCISAVYYGGDYVYDYADPEAADILGPYPQDYYEDRQLRSRDIDEDPSELITPSPGDDEPRGSNRQVERLLPDPCTFPLFDFTFVINSSSGDPGRGGSEEERR